MSVSKSEYVSPPQENYSKNLLLLTNQIERLTMALKQKSDEVEELNSRGRDSYAAQKEVEELITTVEFQTQEIEKWAEKYASLERAYMKQAEQLKDAQKELTMSRTKIQRVEVEQSSTRLSSSQDQWKAQLQSKQKEIEELKSWNAQLRQVQPQCEQLKLQYEEKLRDQQQLHRELMAAEERRIRDSQDNGFGNDEYKRQLQIYKQQLMEIEQWIMSNNMNQNNYNNNSAIIEEKDRLINQLKNDLERCRVEQSKLQSELEITKDQLRKCTQSYSIQYEGNSNVNGSYRNLQTTNTVSNVNNGSNYILEKVRSTLNQIDKSIGQADGLKQSNYRMRPDEGRLSNHWAKQL